MRRDGTQQDDRSRVLCVGRHARLAVALRSAIAGEYDIQHTRDGQAALDLLRFDRFAIAVLDQPGRGSTSGLELARDIRRARPRVGIILCVPDCPTPTGWRALSQACDDYLLKPYRVSELTARLRTVIARAGAAPRSSAVLDWGPLRLDFVRQSVCIHGRESSLQPLQLRLLGYLVQHAGRLVAREELQRQVFRVAHHHGSTSLARQVSVLRRELGEAGALIATHRGGYGIGLLDSAERTPPLSRKPRAERDGEQYQRRSP